jgi:zinc D-Ala-D-Ala carboxypeptidase
LYKFLEENAYKFGFVISYPKDKETITGYSYEPWHIRYIGIALATDFFQRGYLSNPFDYSTKFLREL